MPIQSFKPPLKSDIPEMPSWAEKMLKPINEQIKILTEFLQQQPEDLRDVLLRSGVEVPIKPQGIRGRPKSVEVLFTDPRLFHRESYEIVNEEEIRITVYFSTDQEFSGAPGTVPTEEVLTRLRIRGSSG
jgi:hypothetical protein